MTYFVNVKKLVKLKQYCIETQGIPFPKSEWFVKKVDILNLPTVEAKEVVHARWIWNKECRYYECSNCGGYAGSKNTDYSTPTKYCGDCGAEMEGVK